jgi:hypothetical protein
MRYGKTHIKINPIMQLPARHLLQTIPLPHHYRHYQHKPHNAAFLAYLLALSFAEPFGGCGAGDAAVGMQNEEHVSTGIDKWEKHFVTDEMSVLLDSCGERSWRANAGEPGGCCGVASALDQGEEGAVMGGGMPGARDEDDCWLGRSSHDQESKELGIGKNCGS